VSSDSNQVVGDSFQDGVSSEKDKEIPAQFITNIVKQQNKQHTEKIETINVKETPTFVLLDICSLCVSNEDQNIQKVKENNQKYSEVIFLDIFIKLNKKTKNID
jgi:hypothetical protein